MTGHRKRSLTGAILCVVAVAACTSSASEPHPTSSMTTPSSIPADPQAAAKAEVIAAYAKFWAVVERLHRTSAWKDPALAQVAVEPEFGQLRRRLYADYRAGWVKRGHVEIHAVVVELDVAKKRAAVLYDCQGGALWRYTRDGRPLETHGPTQILGAKVTIVLREGTWKVAGLDYHAGVKCRGTQPVLPSPGSSSSPLASP